MSTDTTTAPAARLLLSADELVDLTGYRQPHAQLAELHRQGFARARRGRAGIVLERAHYEAVCAQRIERPRPKLRMPQLA